MVAVSDAELVQRTIDGDRRSFALLVERHKQSVFGLITKLMGPNDVEDVAQDSFLRAFKSLDSFRGDAKFSTWLYRITWNTCLDRREQRSRRQSREIPVEVMSDVDDDEPMEFADEDADLPDEVLEASDIRERLAKHLDGLSVHFKAVLTLYYFEQMSYDEIAESLDIPMNTVKVHIYRAKAHLKKALLKDNSGEWDT
jgi:RNA polymerase sigma-70 factor, ECF subfamily